MSVDDMYGGRVYTKEGKQLEEVLILRRYPGYDDGKRNQDAPAPFLPK